MALWGSSRGSESNCPPGSQSKTHQLTTRPLPLPHGAPRRSPSSLCPSCWAGTGWARPTSPSHLHLFRPLHRRLRSRLRQPPIPSSFPPGLPAAAPSVRLIRGLLSFPHCHSDLSLNDASPAPHQACVLPTRRAPGLSLAQSPSSPREWRGGGFVLLAAYLQSWNTADAMNSLITE